MLGTVKVQSSRKASTFITRYSTELDLVTEYNYSEWPKNTFNNYLVIKIDVTTTTQIFIN